MADMFDGFGSDGLIDEVFMQDQDQRLVGVGKPTEGWGR